MFLAELSFAAENFRCDAGCAEDVEKILLPQVVLVHEEAQSFERRGSREPKPALLEVFDEESEEIGKLFFGAREGCVAAIEVFEETGEVLVFSLGADDPGRVLRQERWISGNGTGTHFFHFPLS